MTPQALHQLIAAGETLAVEFKGEARVPLNDRDLVEAGLIEERGQKKGRTMIGAQKGAYYVRPSNYLEDSKSDAVGSKKDAKPSRKPVDASAGNGQ